MSGPSGSLASLGAPRSPRYETRALLGEGASGRVFRVFDRERDEEVALKSLRTRSPEDLYHLKREFRLLADIRHPNLARLHELEVTADTCFFTMEIVEGVSFVDHVRSAPGAECAARLREALPQLARALLALHAQSKLHRDVKPGNVLVEPDGRVVLLDFGLVVGMDTEASRAMQRGALAGTFGYMSPEQARGEELTPASDAYGVGVLLYEALTGELPYPAESLASVLSGDREPAAPPSQAAADAPAEFDAIALGLLAPRPEDRLALEALLGLAPTADAAEPGEELAASGAPPFVDRESELAALEAALADVRRGRARALRVEGPSGVGKSTLLEQFIDGHETRGTVVLRARCHPNESVAFEALDGVVDDLSRHLSQQPPERLDAVAPRHLRALQRVFPVLGRIEFSAPRDEIDPTRAEPHEVRRRAFAGLRELLTRLASRRSVVIWIDDLQWGDADSAAFFAELLDPHEAPSLLLLLSYRAEDLETAPLLRSLAALEARLPSGTIRTVRVDPMGWSETKELLAALLGPEHEDLLPFASGLASGARGSPFLLSQLVRALLEREAADPSSPSGGELAVDNVVHVRLRRLGAEAERLLRAVAVAEGPLDQRVAARAAGLRGTGLDVIEEMRRDSLLRISPAAEGRALETYHARIRESVLADLAPEARAESHEAVLEALAVLEAPPVDALLRHAHGAGRLAEAAGYAERAADQAAAALAFGRAAALYGQALAWAPGDAGRERELRKRRAGALANAGHGLEAGEEYLAAARLVEAGTPEARLETLALRARAAEELLVSGHVERGVEELRPVLAAQDLRYPASPERALAGALARLVELAARYALTRPGEGPARPADAVRIDTCHTAAKGLVVVDPVRGTYFSVRSLLLALRSRDPWRIGRGLCVVGAAMVPLGDPGARWARRMLERARRLAERLGDSYLSGISLVSTAQASGVDGDWAGMYKRCADGLRILQEECRGVTWELDIGTMASIRALEEMGQVRELRGRVAGMLQRARALDDRYAEVTALLYSAYWRIAEGDLPGARREAGEALASWARDEMDLQALYGLRIEAGCDVIEGAAERAFARVEAAWSDVERAGLLRHDLVRGDAWTLRGRVALAAGEGEGRALEVAGRAAKALAGERRPDLVATSELLAAGLAFRRGGREEALERLEAAVGTFGERGMPLARGCALRRKGELLGSAAAALLAEADDALAEGTIADPAAWLRFHAPGFGSAAPPHGR